MRLEVLPRRALLLSGFALLCMPVRTIAQVRAPRRDMRFEVWRHGQQIGLHSVAFSGDDRNFSAAIHAEMLVKLGPIPVFRYTHQAQEIWRDGQFAEFESHTVSNGRREQVHAIHAPDGVTIATGAGQKLQAAARTHPLTHWNQAVLDGPLFNPQTGALLHIAVSQSAVANAQPAPGHPPCTACYLLRGDAEIIEWYDADGTWAALRGKAPDGSYIEYRRIA